MAMMDDLDPEQLATRKVYMERRRLVECLTSARINVASAHNSLLNADLWANDEQAPKVRALYEQASRLQAGISALLDEAQGE